MDGVERGPAAASDAMISCPTAAARIGHEIAVTLDSWSQAFQLLASTLQDDWTVVLLDEISWLGGYDPDFPGNLKTAWDNLFKSHPKLILVLCGSVSAWITKNILHNTGFAGRASWDIVLEELPLYHCSRFWGTAGNASAPARS